MTEREENITLSSQKDHAKQMKEEIIEDEREGFITHMESMAGNFMRKYKFSLSLNFSNITISFGSRIQNIFAN